MSLFIDNFNLKCGLAVIHSDEYKCVRYFSHTKKSYPLSVLMRLLYVLHQWFLCTSIVVIHFESILWLCRSSCAKCKMTV